MTTTIISDKMFVLLDKNRNLMYNLQWKEGVCMEKVKTIASIKNDIEQHVGDNVTLKANGGRKKILINDGIIDSVYPSIFVIRLKCDTQRTVTYSYSDVLTKTVQLVFPATI